jgi:chromosome segregation ATPase
MQRCIADIEKESSLAASYSTNEANQVIETATQERDKAQMELDKAQMEFDKAQFDVNALAKKVSGYERFADTITATYNEAQIKKDNAQKGLENMKAETQRLEYQRDQAISNIRRLQAQWKEQDMVFKNEVKKITGLYAMRNIVIVLRSEQISTLALSHFEDLEKYTQDFMDETHEPCSISQARDT